MGFVILARLLLDMDFNMIMIFPKLLLHTTTLYQTWTVSRVLSTFAC
jgi:hypothetical protein